MFDSVLHPGSMHKTRFGTGTLISVVLHATMIASVLYLSSRPQIREKIAYEVKFLTARPPPPPPPPPPKARKVQPKVERRPVEKKPDTIVAPKELPKEPPPKVEQEQEEEDEGVEGGVEGGVPGGVVGGVLGGTVGGTLGGTGQSKVVPSFVFDRERIAYPDPHLPEYFRQSHPKQDVRGMYKICVDTEGKVISVIPMTSIPGMDQIIIDQIKATWRYKPQPVPVCSPRVFLFKIS